VVDRLVVDLLVKEADPIVDAVVVETYEVQQKYC
jgi:hypothetical protein